MKITKRLSLVTAFVLVAFGVGSLVSSAQTYPALTCSVSPSSVRMNEAVTLTATGGTGTYSWSGAVANATTTTSSQFTVSYPNSGNYTVMVNSGTQGANCFVTVTNSSNSSSGSNSSSSSNLMCLPASQTANVGQMINVSATGGSGTYSWYSPDINVSNPIGTGFTATYGTPGAKTISVSSNGQTSVCTINVVGTATTPTPTTPGFPNTGGGYGR